MSSPESTSAGAPAGRRHEVLGILAAALTLLSVLALWSYDARGGENWVGPVGAWAAGVLATAFGLVAWLVPLELGLLTARLFRRGPPAGVASVSATVVVVLVGCALVHLASTGETAFGGHLSGGVLGEVLGEVMRSLLGTIGSYVVGIAILLMTLVLRTSYSLVDAVRGVGRAGSGLAQGVAQGVGSWAREAGAAWAEARELERREREEEEERLAPRIHDSASWDGAVIDLDDDAPTLDGGWGSAALVDDAVDDEDDPDPEVLAPPPLPGPGSPGTVAPSTAPVRPSVSGPAPAGAGSSGVAAPGPAPPVGSAVAARAAPVAAAAGGLALRRGGAPGDPMIVAPKELSSAPVAAVADHGPDAFRLPPPSLLDRPPPQPIEFDEQVLRENAARLTEKLEAYGVRGRVDEIHPGPVVTLYEFEPESGTKIAKIAGLSDDLALALAAQKVRIVAPIPGKARVGFELPNERRQTVYLRDVLEDERWSKVKAALPVAFGKDITGQPVYGDLARMPHLLVAGATGSGKSVGLNVLLASLLTRRSPEEVRLLMIDPKVVELAVFDGIPHMLLPVVTDMKKAALALRWAVDEMERRYQLFADAGARNIASFNAKVDKVKAGTLRPEALSRGRRADAPAVEPTPLPYVVVVVDEFADLMMVAAKDVESAVARLAQKARAAGLHVLLATQRPSVDVITGMIKANFPARVAFKVSQREDSKVILGRSGAEHLLGMGDMLMIPPGASEARRVHSAFISEDEVKRVCDHLREHGTPEYDESILEPRGEDGPAGAGADSDDPTYDRAVACVAQAGYCSISHIQRQLSVGYNKAAKRVERMEREGVVGPPSGKAGGRREVLIQAL
ncbi:MAG: DNA translocase FtsK 4TM domain-containing protein [Sandaracinaceae bacterium]